MKFSWKKYLIIISIISLILALFIPETIEYINLNYINPPKKFAEGINIKFDGLLWTLFYRTLFWFCISFCSFSFLGFIYLLFKNPKGELK